MINDLLTNKKKLVKLLASGIHLPLRVKSPLYYIRSIRLSPFSGMKKSVQPLCLSYSFSYLCNKGNRSCFKKIAMIRWCQLYKMSNSIWAWQISVWSILPSLYSLSTWINTWGVQQDSCIKFNRWRQKASMSIGPTIQLWVGTVYLAHNRCSINKT